MKETSIKKDKVLENLNDKLLEKLKDRGIIAFNLMSLPSKITNLEHTSQFKVVKDDNQTGLMIF